jgi:hypothetical protein
MRGAFSFGCRIRGDARIYMRFSFKDPQRNACLSIFFPKT